MSTRQCMWIPVLVFLGVSLMVGCLAETPAVVSEEEPLMDAIHETDAAMPISIAELFPDGPGKVLVMDNCSACHAVACSVIGQRTNRRWDNLKEDHRDKASNLTEEDLETLFKYLKANFNDSRPEPIVPANFLEGGCTPF